MLDVYDVRTQKFKEGDVVQIRKLPVRTRRYNGNECYYDPRTRLSHLEYLLDMYKLANRSYYVHSVIRCKYGYLYQISLQKGDSSTLTPYLWSNKFLIAAPNTNQEAVNLLDPSND